VISASGTTSNLDASWFPNLVSSGPLNLLDFAQAAVAHGTQEIMVINHTDCSLMHTSEQELRTRIQDRTGTAAIAPTFFFAFQNIEENVRHQLQKLHTHPWIPLRLLAYEDPGESNRVLLD
jgi:carbonic anhydrase